MSPAKTLQERQKELQSLLATPAGREEVEALAARYAAAGGPVKIHACVIPVDGSTAPVTASSAVYASPLTEPAATNAAAPARRTAAAAAAARRNSTTASS